MEGIHTGAKPGKAIFKKIKGERLKKDEVDCNKLLFNDYKIFNLF
jgi:hypothetical protein